MTRIETLSISTKCQFEHYFRIQTVSAPAKNPKIRSKKFRILILNSLAGDVDKWYFKKYRVKEQRIHLQYFTAFYKCAYLWMMAPISIPNSYEIYIVYRAAQVSYSRRHLFLSQVFPRLHCSENPIYVFLFWELRGLKVPISKFMCLRAINIFPGLVHMFPESCSRLGRSIIMGIYK